MKLLYDRLNLTSLKWMDMLKLWDKNNICLELIERKRWKEETNVFELPKNSK